MRFSNILGQEHIKNHLQQSANNGRIPHAQLFVGNEGSGTLPMAIAYANELLCGGSNKNESCSNKINKLAHPDLHFVYPVNTNDKIKKNPVSSNFSEEWRSFVQKNPYGSLFEWFQELGIENKQGNISVHDAEDIGKSLIEGAGLILVDQIAGERGDAVCEFMGHDIKSCSIRLSVTEEHGTVFGGPERIFEISADPDKTEYGTVFLIKRCTAMLLFIVIIGLGQTVREADTVGQPA